MFGCNVAMCSWVCFVGVLVSAQWASSRCTCAVSSMTGSIFILFCILNQTHARQSLVSHHFITLIPTTNSTAKGGKRATRGRNTRHIWTTDASQSIKHLTKRSTLTKMSGTCRQTWFSATFTFITEVVENPGHSMPKDESKDEELFLFSFLRCKM